MAQLNYSVQCLAKIDRESHLLTLSTQVLQEIADSVFITDERNCLTDLTEIYA